MSRIFSQTDVAANCGAIVACSGATLISQPRHKECREGGSAGGAQTITIPSGTTRGALMYQLENIRQANWQAGDWVLRINVTTANADVTWEEAYICRINSCVSAATVGSDVAISQLLNTTGVKTVTISGSAQSSEGDDAYLVFVFSSAATMGNSSFGVTHDQDIDTPLIADRRIFLIN